MLADSLSGQRGHKVGRGQMDSSQADISYQQGWVHILILAWALVGPILSGKHRNKDTGHQEAIPVGERGRGPLSRTSSGLLCIILTGGRQEESREDKNRHSSRPFPHMLTKIRLFEDQDMTTRCQDTHCSKGHSEGASSQTSLGNCLPQWAQSTTSQLAEGP